MIPSYVCRLWLHVVHDNHVCGTPITMTRILRIPKGHMISFKDEN